MSPRRAIAALALLLLLGFLRGAGRRAERIVAAGGPAGRAELVVAALLLAGAACAVVFVLAYAMDWSNLTQWLGLSLGAALGLFATALIVASRHLVVNELLDEEYPPEGGERGAQSELTQMVAEGGERITRRRLLGGAAGAAGAALGAALLAPAASLGPALDTGSLYRTPWRRDRRLVDESGEPLRAEDIETGTFYTAYPENADRRELAAPLVLVRVRTDELRMPTGREGWTPEGIVAYSKICTHAACAVSIYRTPLFEPTQPRPALVCPCHYSTFDPASGGDVLYGPAGRPLPQLPLLVDSEGDLRAAGDLSEPVGPSFWGVRTRRPS